MASTDSGKIVAIDDFPAIREKNSKQRIVLCHGVFDVLHAGHLAYFQSAKKMGDLLVVTVTADEFVNKGPGRPYFPAMVRGNMLAALGVVDFVAINHAPTAVPAIKALKPDFYVKGPDYKVRSHDPTGEILNEERAVIQAGGKIAFTSEEMYSSSSLINEFFPMWSDQQLLTIDEMKRLGGLDRFQEILHKLEKQDVLVLGEPIVDTYVFCAPESISSKSPAISARFIHEENYAGGSLAIANYLSDFVGKVRLMATHGAESYFRELIRMKLDPRVDFQGHVLDGIPTPRKTRYIADDRIQRLFEITQIRIDQWVSHDPAIFCQHFRKAIQPNQAVIVADFGHGMIEGKILSDLAEVNSFLALNVQTNSSNFGFNPFKKHKRFSYLSIDLKEARVAFQDRYSTHAELFGRVRTEFKEPALAMTLGNNGSAYMGAHSKEVIMTPAFADRVIDPIGAGDAFFALSAVLIHAGCPAPMIPFIANVFAGLKTRIMGHERSVSKAQLIKAVTSILK